jgi:hypothetical protein
MWAAARAKKTSNQEPRAPFRFFRNGNGLGR